MFDALDTEGRGGTAFQSEASMTAAGDRARRARRGIRFAAVFSAAALILFVGGFGLFLADISRYGSAPADVQADGIVVLTGGHARVDEAVKLLGDERGERLLISGVHPAASRTVLKKTFAVNEAQFACCVDIDRAALDTTGNATETARWAADHRFTSLIVVTNDYHMPRSLLELHRTMQGVTLIPHAVVTGQRGTMNTQERVDRYRVLVGEYLKYTAALARSLVAPAPANAKMASAR